MGSKDKVVVYLDINNLFHRYKKLDFIKLKEYISGAYDIVKITAFNSIDHTNQNQIKFNTYLSNNGYRIEDPDVNVMSNVDFMIITQMGMDSNCLSHTVVIIVACDGGYSYTLNELSKAGYRIVTIGCKENTNLNLLKVSDEVVYLENLNGVIL
jgi:hypothetical protein